jgi:hypothetical protein
VLLCCCLQTFGVSKELLARALKMDPQLMAMSSLPARVNNLAEAMQWDRQQLLAQLLVSASAPRMHTQPATLYLQVLPICRTLLLSEDLEPT